MAFSLIGASKSGIDVLDLQAFAFVETFPVLKVVLALFIIPLLMYTCRQKFTKRYNRVRSLPNSRAEEHEDSRTKDDSIPEKSSDSLTENKVKKRRVRKKKPRKQDSEYGEESRDASEARENTDTKSVSEEVKVTKRRNKAYRSRGYGLDNGSCRSESENLDTAGQGEQIKYGNRRNKGPRSNGADIGSAPSRSVNDGEVPAAAGPVENVKFYVKRRNKGVGNCARVDSENNVSRTTLNSNDTLELSSTAGEVKDAKTHEEIVSSRGGNVRDELLESSSIVKEDKTVTKASKVVTPRKANDLGKNSCPSEGVKILKRRNKIVSASCAKEREGEEQSLNCGLKEGVNNIKRPEKVVDSRNVHDTGGNSGTVKEVKHVKILKRGPPTSPVGSSVCMVLDQSNVRWDHLPRNRPSKAHNRDDSCATDVTQGGVTQGRNAAAGVTQRRRSFSDRVTKDSSGMERKENASRVETTEEYTKSRSPGDFSGDVPVRGFPHTSAAIGNKPTKNRWRVYIPPRRRSFDHLFEKERPFEGGDHLENQRPCTTDNRGKSDEPENPEREPQEEETATNPAELSTADRIRTMDGGDTNTPCERVAYSGMLTAQTNISAETAKDIESLRQPVEFSPAPIEETQMTSDGHVVIDPAVRERIANPKCPVRMPERPFESLRFHDFTKRDCGKRRNKSRVNGLFGREWREKFEAKQQREFEEEDRESEESFLDVRDNICPTFMIWGVCHRGDRCHLRHPSYRYLERPKKATANPEPVDEGPKPRDPKSYASILEKNRSPETEGFVNDCFPKNCSTEETIEEAWPALGSPEQGRTTKSSKAWRPKRDTPNAPDVWVTNSTTQKGPWILEEKPEATVDQLQIASDELIADSLQADEYATLDVYDETNQDYYTTIQNYNPEPEVNEDEFLENVEETNTEDENSFHTPREGKVVNENHFNSSSSSPVILEKASSSIEDPGPPKLSNTCDICMDRPKDATLVCGHRYCYQCALQMRLDERVCAICRRCIVSVIKTYN